MPSPKLIGLILAPLLALGLYLLPLGLPENAHLTACIMIFCLTFWMLEVLPLSITALLGVALAVLLGLTTPDVAFSGLGHPIILLFIGSFLLARAMTRHGLDRRLALLLLSLPFFQKSLFRMFLGFSAIAFVLSMWISNSVTIAMLLPLVVGLLQVINDPEKLDPHLPVYLLLGIAYSASIGGTSTIIGSPPNLIGVQYLQQAGVPIDFLQWMALTMPVALSLYGVMLLYVWYRLKSCVFRPEAIQKYVAGQAAQRQPLSRGEQNTLFVFGMAVVLWLLPGVLNLLGQEELSATVGKYFSESIVALLAAVMLYLLPTDSSFSARTLIPEDLKLIDWDTILLFGGGIALGKLITETGLAAAIGGALTEAVGGGNQFLLVLLLISGILFLTEISSNTAIAITFVPIVLDVVQQLQMPVLYPVLGIVLASSCAFMLPVATPPNAIVYGSGQIPLLKMVKTGLWLNIAAAIIIFGWMWFYMQ